MKQLKYQNLSQITLKKIKEYREGNEYNYSYSYYYDWALVDGVTGSVVGIADRLHSKENIPRVSTQHIRQMFGNVDIKFYKELFKQNSKLFHMIEDLDPVIKFEVFGGTLTQQKLDSALKNLNKAEQQYRELKKKLYKL